MNSVSRSHLVITCLVPFALLAFSGARPARLGKVKPIPYSKVAPLIKAQCASCHNAANHPEKVDLSSYQAMMKSGDHGPIVVAGHPEKSKLIAYVDGTKKPQMPMGKPPLSKANVALLKQWVSSGAKG